MTARGNLTPSSQIALRAHLSILTGGRWTITLDECFTSVRATYPLLGRVVERRDIAHELRKLGFRRDRDQVEIAYRHASLGDAR